MENKKSIQLSQAFGAVLTLVLVAVLVIVAIVIFVQLATSFEAGQTVSVANESIEAFAGTTNQSLDGAAACGFGTVSTGTVVVYNTTNDFLIPADNYTAYSDGNIINLTVLEALHPWKVSYDYTWGSEACDASEEMTSEFGNYTSLVGLVGTIIFLGLVIGILVAAFAFGGRRET